MNTTELIRHWTMEGAAPDVGDRFSSMAGVLGIPGDADEPPTGTQAALRMRPSDEEEWKPLLLATGEK